MRRIAGILVGAVALCAASTPVASAEFPYELPATERPNDLSGKLDWMYAADKEPGNEPVNSSPFELFGVRGAHIADKTTPRDDLGWGTTTGRPDVTIAVLDSGIKWNDEGAMQDLRRKTRLSKSELPQPQHDRTTATEEGEDCSTYADADDANGDGVFNVVDYACDSRVDTSPAGGDGPPLLDPQDVLIAFSDGTDGDGNGFKDDIVGWDFVDDDNDPFDDVQYGHGTGEARDSTAEADNGGELGACPNCMSVHMRVGDSFIADANRFAQATIYAVDNDVQVVQEALGTLNQTKLARQAVEYAYDHGVTIIASAADEAAQHHNWPSSYPHVIVVNSATKYGEETVSPRSYLQFNGCTNFSSKITLAIPSVSCSSDATGRASGMAGLVYSAALDALDAGDLERHPTCRDVDGDSCLVTMNEVRQLMASGSVDGKELSDDVNFEGDAGASCQDALLPTCTDPNANAPTVFTNRALVMAPPNSRSYPARKGHDQFYGFGRVNMNSALDATRAGELPPEVEITGPDWFEQVDPRSDAFEVRGHVDARGGAYECRVLVAPGSYPTHGTAAHPEGDFVEIPSGHCSGDERTGRFDGVLGSIAMDDLKALFPANTGGFDGREPGVGTQQTSNGRPNTEPYGFIVKVVAEAGERRGQDLRNFHLHRDADMLNEHFPKELDGDGESSPLFVDLDGDNRNELVFGSADGLVHAWRPDGTELPGWPVKGDALPLHTGEFEAAGAFLASVAAGDLNRDGSPEVVAADFEGKVYAWNAAGERVFEQEANPDWSGRPLAPFVEERRGKRNRTQHGFVGSPVLADLDQDDGGRLEIVAAGMDRHVYAWNDDGSEVPGYPVLVVDPSKVASIDSDSHAVRFKEGLGDEFNQGAIVDTPAVGDVSGDGKPEVVVGTNESYEPNQGDEGPHNTDSPSLTALGAVMTPSNGRLYALRQSGDEDGDGLPTTGNPFLDGWPFKVAIGVADLLPVVGEGITGSPVLAPIDCPNGGDGLEVGVIPGVGAGYLVNGNAASCHGEVGGRDRSLNMEGGSGPSTDKPAIPAVGHPAFGDLGGSTSFLAPAAGAMRALDAAFPEYQQGSQDQLAVWESASGQFRPGWPALMNDLQFLTGPSVADIDGRPGQEVVAGSAHNDLQAFNAAGVPASTAWPKLTSDWMVANPLIGSFGTLDTEADARKAVVAFTRSGRVLAYGADAPACSPASWPRFHHDNANSGNYERDAVLPGAPMEAVVKNRKLTLKAPGDDLLCGTADRYEIRHSGDPIETWGDGDPIDASSFEPAEPGAEQTIELPKGTGRFVAIRALDDQDNAGRFVVAESRRSKP